MRATVLVLAALTLSACASCPTVDPETFVPRMERSALCGDDPNPQPWSGFALLAMPGLPTQAEVTLWGMNPGVDFGEGSDRWHRASHDCTYEVPEDDGVCDVQITYTCIQREDSMNRLGDFTATVDLREARPGVYYTDGDIDLTGTVVIEAEDCTITFEGTQRQRVQ